MNKWLSQCKDFEHILEPDEGHIGLKNVVRKNTRIYIYICKNMADILALLYAKWAI
jgi:hypothetical protein